METLKVSVTIDNTICFDSYYYVTSIQCTQIINWYQQFNTDGKSIQISESLKISPEDLIIEIIKDIDLDLSSENTSNILEHIPDLSDIFENPFVNVDSDSDTELYTETEKCINLIDAHMKGDKTQVSKIIVNMPNSNIVKTIKKNIY